MNVFHAIINVKFAQIRNNVKTAFNLKTEI
jgi:hypothetical protein